MSGPQQIADAMPLAALCSTAAGLRRVVEAAGLGVLTLAVRRVVARENFIYCRARKP